MQPDERLWAPVPTGTARVRGDSESTGGALTIMELATAVCQIGSSCRLHQGDGDIC
jgi:hypothetical protein